MSNESEVVESPDTLNSMVKTFEDRDNVPCPDSAMSSSRAVFRLRVHLPAKQDLQQKQFTIDYKAPSQPASAIHAIGEEHHQESCCADTQERSSQCQKQMAEATVQTKFMKIHNKESEHPLLQQEQRVSGRTIRFLLIVFITLAVIYILITGSQFVYLDVEGIARSWSLKRCIPKLCFAGRCSPPV